MNQDMNLQQHMNLQQQGGERAVIKRREIKGYTIPTHDVNGEPVGATAADGSWLGEGDYAPPTDSKAAHGDGKGRGAVRCKSPTATGRRCINWGVIPTDACAMHGGVLKKLRELESGRYSKALASNTALRETFEAFFVDPNITDVRSELALERALLNEYIQNYVLTDDGDVTISPQAINALHQMNRQVAELARQVEESQARTPTSLTAIQFVWVMEQLSRCVSLALNEAFPDERDAERRTIVLELLADALDAIVVSNPRGSASLPERLAAECAR